MVVVLVLEDLRYGVGVYGVSHRWKIAIEVVRRCERDGLLPKGVLFTLLAGARN